VSLSSGTVAESDAVAVLRSNAGGKIDAATAPNAPSVPPGERAERRQVTVMFSDLVGSTALSAPGSQ
jgi:class 3 adenylate cyclase